MKKEKKVFVLCYWSHNGDDTELEIEGVTDSKNVAKKHAEIYGCCYEEFIMNEMGT